MGRRLLVSALSLTALALAFGEAPKALHGASLVAGPQSADPLTQNEWSLAQTHVRESWTLTRGAPETVVAIVDTGVDPDQPDLVGALVPGWNAVTGDADTRDENGHGTAVAGMIAARSNGTGAEGVCPRCSVMPVKVFDASGSATAARIADGIRWAVDHGARIVNMSFVLNGDDAAIESALAYAAEHGVVLVGGAGNSGGETPQFPAAMPAVLGVAAVDEAGALYGWSARGPWVDLAAPGCSVSTLRGGTFGEFCGTSAASAFTAGVAGLAVSWAPSATAADIVRALEATAVHGVAVAYGRIDAAAALTALRPAPLLTLVRSIKPGRVSAMKKRSTRQLASARATFRKHRHHAAKTISPSRRPR